MGTPVIGTPNLRHSLATGNSILRGKVYVLFPSSRPPQKDYIMDLVFCLAYTWYQGFDTVVALFASFFFLVFILWIDIFDFFFFFFCGYEETSFQDFQILKLRKNEYTGVNLFIMIIFSWLLTIEEVSLISWIVFY